MSKLRTSVLNRQTVFVYLDPSITWTSHLKDVTNTVNRKLGLIYRSRNFLNSNILKTLYESLSLIQTTVMWYGVMLVINIFLS